MAKKKAEKEEHRAIRKKKAVQKANQQAGLSSGSDDEFEPRANIMVVLFNSLWSLILFYRSPLVRLRLRLV